MITAQDHGPTLKYTRETTRQRQKNLTALCTQHGPSWHATERFAPLCRKHTAFRKGTADAPQNVAAWATKVGAGYQHTPGSSQLSWNGTLTPPTPPTPTHTSAAAHPRQQAWPTCTNDILGIASDTAKERHRQRCPDLHRPAENLHTQTTQDEHRMRNMSGGL